MIEITFPGTKNLITVVLSLILAISVTLPICRPKKFLLHLNPFHFLSRKVYTMLLFFLYDWMLFLLSVQYIWVKVFKNGPCKICGRQVLKKLKWYGLLRQTIFEIFQRLSSTNFTCSILWYLHPYVDGHRYFYLGTISRWFLTKAKEWVKIFLN